MMTESEIIARARELMALHGLDHVPAELFNSKRRLGQCTYKSQSLEIVRLEFSRQLLPLVPDIEVVDVILHEIAHALTPGSGHGFIWKMKAREIGARPEPCNSYAIDAMRVGWKYIATCACGPIHGKARQTTRRYRCSTCKQSLEYVQQY